MSRRLLTWVYEKAGARYPTLYLALELQSAWLIVIATLGIFSLYYDASFGEFWIIGLGVIGMTGLAILINFLRTRRYAKPLRDWIRHSREDPSQEDPVLATRAWETAVSLPMAVARREMRWPLLLVAIPGIVAALLTLDLSPLAAVPLTAGSLIAIGYGGVLHYFGLEAGMRPVLRDINREHPPWARTEIRALPLRFKLLAALPLINIITGLVAAALAGGGGGSTSLSVDVLIATGVAFTISLLLSVMLTNSILRPIGDLGEGIEAVRQGRYGVTVPVTTTDEIGDLSAAFNQMSKGLAERERIRDAFGTYLDGSVADHILREGGGPSGTMMDVSLLFCDVRDFTAFAAQAEAPDVVARLNQLFEAVVPIIAGHGGHVNKFVGDGLLAVFGAPEAYEDHAERAVRCAIAMAQRVNHGGSGLFTIGIGVNSGRVVAGAIGGAGRLEYSVIGDAVNVAARVEAATRQLQDEVLITEDTRVAVGSTVELVRRGPIEIRGRPQPIEVWAPVVQTAERRLPSREAG